MAVNPTGDDNLAGNPFLDSDGDVHLNATTIYAEAANIVLDTTTGTKIGTATTEKLGFFNATPIVQRAAWTQTYSTADKTVSAPTAETLTDSTTGTASNTLAAGVGIETIALPITLANITGAADVLTAFTPGYKFKLLATSFAVTTAATTGSKAATLNLEIGTTNVTGGEVALTSANCTPLGAVVAGAAITALNTGTSSDTISVESASVTAFVEGAGVLYMRIQNMDTADAFASLVDEQAKAAADDLDNRKSITALVDDLQALGLVG